MQLVQTLSVIDAAEARRSIRSYAPTQVPDEDLREILRVAGLAPSAFNAQPWRFTVVQDLDLKARLTEAAYGQKQVSSAPTVIVVHSDMADVLAHAEETVHPGMGSRAAAAAAAAASLRAQWENHDARSREEWGAGQSYIALGFLLLAAQSLGYGTSPMLGFDADRVKTLLGLPEHVRIPALVAIGVPAEEGFPHHRHEIDRIATFR